ncbi:MAG: LppX_LprAFG lipoprotein [Thermomicrobiales bacterium]
MRRGKGAWLTSLIAVWVLVGGLVGCGGGGDKTSNLDTASILTSTSKRLDALKAVHFTLAIEGAAFIDTDRTTQLRSASGDIIPPDQMQTKLTAAIATLNFDVSLVAIGADRYMTNPVTGQWGPAQEGFDYSPTVLFDKEKGLSTVIGKLKDVEQVGVEKVNGVDTYHLRGKAERAVVEPLTSGAIDGDPIGVEFWVSKDRFDLIKLVLTEPKTPEKQQPAVWTLTFSNFDTPVTITKPQ